MGRPPGVDINPHALQALRELRGLTQSRLAVLADCSTTTMSDLENGRGRPSKALLHRIASNLRVTPLALMGIAPSAPAPDLEVAG